VLGHGTGTVADNTLTRLGSINGASRAAQGRGSMLERMSVKLRGANGFDDVWFVDVPEPSAGTAATGTIEVTAAATAAGVLYLYIAGQKVSVAIASGDTATQVATKVKTAIDAALDLPVTCARTNAVLTLTCRWKGLTGNDIDIRTNYLRNLGSEALPAGVALTITAMASGAGVPDLTDAIAAIGDEEFETIVHSWTDTATLNAIDTAWGHGDDGRWGWLKQLYGHVWSMRPGTFGDLGTFGDARNGGEQTTIGYTGSPSPPWEWAGAIGGVVHRALMNDPARPLGTLEVPGVLAADPADRLTAGEKNALLWDGISVVDETADGRIVINQVVTHYQRNAFGLDDNSLLKVNTKATYAYVMRSQRFHIAQRFPRHKIANDGTRFGAGQAITTPTGIKAEIYAHYVAMENLGLLENAATAMRNTIVERDVTNPDRVNVLYAPDFVNQLDVFAVIAQFRLQYPAETGEVAIPVI